jgi:hypothetical protein
MALAAYITHWCSSQHKRRLTVGSCTVPGFEREWDFKRALINEYQLSKALNNGELHRSPIGIPLTEAIVKARTSPEAIADLCAVSIKRAHSNGALAPWMKQYGPEHPRWGVYFTKEGEFNLVYVEAFIPKSEAKSASVQRVPAVIAVDPVSPVHQQPAPSGSGSASDGQVELASACPARDLPVWGVHTHTEDESAAWWAAWNESQARWDADLERDAPPEPIPVPRFVPAAPIARTCISDPWGEMTASPAAPVLPAPPAKAPPPMRPAVEPVPAPAEFSPVYQCTGSRYRSRNMMTIRRSPNGYHTEIGRIPPGYANNELMSALLFVLDRELTQEERVRFESL